MNASFNQANFSANSTRGRNNTDSALQTSSFEFQENSSESINK